MLPDEKDGQTAIVVVSKDWFNTPGIRHVLARGIESRSSGPTHLLIGPLADRNDPHGLWVKGITATNLTRDASPVKLEFMIPWGYVYGLALVQDESAQGRTVGFKVDAATTLVEQPTETAADESSENHLLNTRMNPGG